MGSSRLPGKVLRNLGGKPMLMRVVARLLRAQRVDRVVVVTSNESGDDPIEELCEGMDWPYFRGSEKDVLDRFAMAQDQFKSERVVRVTADCPLIDPAVLDHVVSVYVQGEWDYVSNTLERTYPRGLDVEIFSGELLQEIANKAHDPVEREHVTPYIYRRPDLFRIEQVKQAIDRSGLRWTVDTPKDFEFVEKIYESLADENASAEVIYQLLEKHPDWIKINESVEQKIV